MRLTEQVLNIRRLSGITTTNEGLNLNFAKQVRAYQKTQPSDAKLEAQFGKNVFRLYYDLDTGKQIQPGKKVPTLNFDVKIVDELKQNISDRLVAFNYSLVDLDGNVAKNDKNDQQTKITKLLQKLDVGLLKKYTNYLDSMTKNVEGKFYAVISRHSYDFAMMGSHEEFSSCEDLSDKTDISDTKIKNDDDEEDGYDGEGIRTATTINNGGVLFYMIREGDWNIQKPLARFANAVYCIDSGNIWGKYSPKFKQFIQKWLQRYELDVEKVKGLMSEESFFSQDVKTLSEQVFKVFYHNHSVNNMDNEEFLRGLIKYKRFDAITAINKTSETKRHLMINMVNLMAEKLSPKILDVFPPELQVEFNAMIDTTFDNEYKSIKGTYDRIRMGLTNPNKLVEPLIKHLGTMLKKLDGYQIISLFALLNDDIDHVIPSGKYGGLIQFAKVKHPTEVSDLLKYTKFVDNYSRGGGQGELISKIKQSIETNSQLAISESLIRMKTLMCLKESDNESEAAGAQIICEKTKRTLVGLRSKTSESPLTWSGFGGSLDIKDGQCESVKEAIVREMKEEIGYEGKITLVHEYQNKDKAKFTYHNFIGLVPEEFDAKLNNEHAESKWVTYDELKDLKNKHFGLVAFMKERETEFKKYLK